MFFCFLFIFGCKKDKTEIFDNSQLDSDSLYLFLKNHDNNTLSDKENLNITNSAYNYILKSSKNDTLIRNSLFKVVNSYSRLNQNKLVIESNNLLLEKAIEKKDTLSIANSYFISANNFFYDHVVDSAFYYSLKAEKFYLLKRETKNLGTIYLNRSLILLEINDLYGAEYSATQSLKQLKINNDILGEYDAYTNLGIIANESENYEKAIEYHKKAFEIAKKYSVEYNNFFLEEVSLNNIGNTYQNAKKYNEAILQFKNALSNKNLYKLKPSLYATLIDNVAYSKFKLKEFSDLPKLFFESLKIRENLNVKSKIIFSKIHLSEYYFFTNDTIEAKNFAFSSLDIARKTKSPLDILASLKQLSIVDKSKSTNFSNEYYKLNDSLQIVERNSKDRFARIQFETDEIIKQKDDLIEQNRDILNYFMGIMGFVGILFFMRAQRARRRELILTQSQQRANEELYKLIISQQSKLDEGKVFEKNRIAKELHDGVLGRMFGLRLNLDGLNKRTDEEGVEERLRYLEELKTIEQDLREISHELSREKFVLINNFVAIVNGLLEEQTKINSAKLTTVIGENIDWDLLSNTTKINLYRILQESLQNINKYANASFIKIEFKKDKKGNLILNIVDDGNGYDVKKKSSGIGMKNMVDRTHESNGTIEIKSEKNKGTQVLVVVPLENKTIKV